MAKGFRGGMGMGGNMSQVMAQAQRMQRQIEMAQAEIQEMRFLISRVNILTANSSI